MTSFRMGVLGAARIAPKAFIQPARSVPEVEVAAVAARDPKRAEDFAKRHHIEATHPTYADLIEDPTLDAVYIPLPNGLHARWTIEALEKGKHVLCEKPLAAKASEAGDMVAAAERSQRVLMEAFHYRYHPLAERMRAIANGGQLGEIKEVKVWMCFPLPRFSDIRYNFDLAGGALMDAGCYAVHCLRLVGPGEPTVVRARAKTLRRDRRIDRAMGADFSFSNGATGHIETSMWSGRLLRIAVHVKGDHGELRVMNFVLPHSFHQARLTVDGKTEHLKVPGEPTYLLQLRAFVAAIKTGEPSLTSGHDGITNMTIIDDIYRAAGLPLRGTLAQP